MVAEGRRSRRGKGDCRLAREGSERRQGTAGAGGMDEDRIEGVGRDSGGLDGLIDRQDAGLDLPLQQGRQIAGRLPRAGDQQRAGAGSLRGDQGRQPIEVAIRGLNLCEARRPGGPGRGVADGEDRSAAVRGQGGEGGDAIGAGEGEGGDGGQIGRGLGDRANGQKGGDDGLEAEGGQAVGGARSAGLGARDPDAADRRQGSTRWSPAAAWTSAPSRRPRARA